MLVGAQRARRGRLGKYSKNWHLGGGWELAGRKEPKGNPGRRSTMWELANGRPSPGFVNEVLVEPPRPVIGSFGYFLAALLCAAEGGSCKRNPVDYKAERSLPLAPERKGVLTPQVQEVMLPLREQRWREGAGLM